MKKNNTLLIILFLFFGMVFTLTSCIGDDDDNKTKELTPYEKESIMRSLAGSYTGKVHFYNPGHIDMKDSLEMHWTLSDRGLFDSEDFPVEYLRNFVSNTSEEYQILSAATRKAYKGAIDPIQSQQISTGVLYLCRFTPNSFTYSFKVEYDGNDYDVNLSLLSTLVRQEGAGSSNYSSISEFSDEGVGETRVTKMYGYILMEKMTINGKTIPINDYAMVIGHRHYLK